MSRPLDYSKWDAIELSDDEDIEVHKNIDKASFIRWKQVGRCCAAVQFACNSLLLPFFVASNQYTLCTLTHAHERRCTTQADIHRQREERRQRIALCKQELQTNDELALRVQQLVPILRGERGVDEQRQAVEKLAVDLVAYDKVKEKVGVIIVEDV